MKLETEFATRREIEEKHVILLPFIIDDTPIDSVSWYLRTRNLARVDQTDDGARAIASTVRQALERRSPREEGLAQQGPPFQEDPQVKRIVSKVGAGDWDAAYRAALLILSDTTPAGRNSLFEALISYIDYPSPDEEIKWGALLTIEGMAQLAPWLFDRPLLFRMGTHKDFSVRSSAASIIMDFSNWAPDRVPTDLMIRLARFDEDWYVMAPATAALKTLCATRPALQLVLMSSLRSRIPQEREHAASALADLADREPGTLEPGELEDEARRLRELGDSLPSQILERALSQVRKGRRSFRFKYCL